MDPRQSKVKVNLIITEVNLSHTEAKYAQVSKKTWFNPWVMKIPWRREWLQKGRRD